MIEKQFEEWFEEIKENAKNDFGYSEYEIEKFTSKTWSPYFEKGLSPFESISNHLKEIFKNHNG
jgi:hypothetical protein